MWQKGPGQLLTCRHPQAVPQFEPDSVTLSQRPTSVLWLQPQRRAAPSPYGEFELSQHRRQASAVDGDSSQPPHFPTLPRLTSSANDRNPTQQPLRTQQPQCAESTAARPKERLPGAMTIKALILRANNAVFPDNRNHDHHKGGTRARSAYSSNPLEILAIKLPLHSFGVLFRKWSGRSPAGFETHPFPVGAHAHLSFSQRKSLPTNELSTKIATWPLNLQNHCSNFEHQSQDLAFEIR